MENLRIEALDRAVRVALAIGGDHDGAATVKRAEAFLTFLEGRNAAVHVRNVHVTESRRRIKDEVDERLRAIADD